jgi:hypothetical protein
MGEVTVALFSTLAVIGLVLVAIGLFRGARSLTVVGCALLLALAGAWTIGPPGAAAGLVAFGFLGRGRSPRPPSTAQSRD